MEYGRELKENKDIKKKVNTIYIKDNLIVDRKMKLNYELQKIKKKVNTYILQNTGECKVWIINISDFYTDLEIIRSCVSDVDIKRYQQIKNDEKGVLFLLRKGIARIILSSVLGIKPSKIKYKVTNYGKPFISLGKNDHFAFNISHSKEYLVVGLSKSCNIGVDIEKIRPNLDCSLLCRSTFSDEELIIFNNIDKANQLEFFYKTWVQKEAISKLVGLGISIGFNKFSVEEDFGNSIKNIDTLALRVNIEVKSNRDYIFAVALLEKKVKVE